MKKAVNFEAEKIVDFHSALGESPVWDHKTNRLYWVDYTDRKINCYDYERRSSRCFELDVTPGCVAPTENGKLFLGYGNDIGLYDMESGKLTTLFSPEKGKDYNHFNDGKCDAAGRMWIGSITEEQTWPGAALYKVEGKKSCQMVLDNVTTSNGLAWTEDNRTFYYIDTMTYSVAAYDFDLEKGSLANRRVVIDFRSEKGRPDGMTIDNEGCLWIAHWNGGQVSRWNPMTGECLSRIPIPAFNVTSCFFGGPDFDELFITSARVETSEQKLEEYPLSGGTFVLVPGVSGFPVNYVKGM